MPNLKAKKHKARCKKVSKSFSGETILKQLPDNTYFKTVGKDGKLSKSTYIKPKRSWNRFSKRYDVCNVNDVGSEGIEMKGDRKVSTRFIY